MASIQVKGNKFYVVFDDPNTPNKRSQIWKPFDTIDEAELFQDELKIKVRKGKFISPSKVTVEELANSFVEVYAPQKWSPSNYDTNTGLTKHHIINEIGNRKVQAITPRDIELLINRLRCKKVSGPKSYNKPESEIPSLSSTTVRLIHGLLVKMFEKAIEWKVIEETPVLVERPKKAKSKRTGWHKSAVTKALDNITDERLHLAVHLSFICSVREGECAGIKVENIDFVKNRIYIDRTLQRVSKEALEKLPQDDIIFIFPEKIKGKKSVLILKTPKTETGERYVYFTNAIRDELLNLIKRNETYKSLAGNKYTDYDLLFAFEDGSPIEPGRLEKWFKKWQLTVTDLELKKIVFHELRHSSTSYRVGLSGNLITVMHGNGHASLQSMDPYAHDYEEDQRELVALMEDDFYNKAKITGTTQEIGNYSDDDLLHALAIIKAKDPELYRTTLDAAGALG